MAAATLITACQSGGPPALSLEEAKQVTAEFAKPAFVPPQRTIGDIRQLIGEPKTADQDCAEVQAWRNKSVELDVERTGNSPRGVAATAAPLAVVVDGQLDRGNYKNTAELLTTAISRHSSKRSDPLKRGVFRSQLARLRAAIGDYPGAERALSTASSEWFKTRNPRRDVYRTYYTSWGEGEIAQSRGFLPTAETHYRRAREAGRRVIGRARLLASQLARNLLLQGRLVEAEVEARQAIRSAWISGDPYSSTTAKTLTLLAEIRREQGNIEDTEYLTRRAVSMHEYDCAPADSLSFAFSRQVLAGALAAKGDWPGALEQFELVEQGLAGEPESLQRLFGGNIDWALALLNTGRAQDAVKRLEGALSLARERSGEDSYKVAEIQALVGVIKHAAGDNDGALSAFRQAVPRLLAARRGQQGNVGRWLLDSRLRLILETYLNILLDSRGAAGEAQAGPDAVREAFGIANSLRARSVDAAVAATGARSRVSDPELAALVRRAQDAAEAIGSAMEMLRNLDAAAVDQKDPELVKAIRLKVDGLRTARLVLLAEIDRRFPEYAELINPRPMTIEQARAVLRPGEALVATYVGAEKTYVWAVAKEGEMAFATVDLGKTALAEMVSLLRTALDPGYVATIGDIPAFDATAAYDLYAKLLKPVEAGWKPATSLLVVADGPLGQLPLSLLPSEPAEATPGQELMFANYRNVRWLARTHAVTILPSVASLKALRGTAAAGGRRSFAGFGDPFFSKSQQLAAGEAGPVQVASREGSSRGMPVNLRSKPETRGVDSATLALLPRLPDSRTEIKAIAEALGADPARDVFLGRRAGEGRVKTMDLSLYQVISFATHGLVPGDLNGLDQPALAFSHPQVTGEADEDGLLTMGEILGLKLNADWAVLSACNTASADGAGAEAVSGLGRAFFYAGARALLVSNWPVHSAATTELTTELFSRQAADDNLSRAEALRQTRVHLIDNAGFTDAQGRTLFSYAHPIFWAPFTIVGDGGGGRPPPS